jgi:hypothetical protein
LNVDISLSLLGLHGWDSRKQKMMSRTLFLLLRNKERPPHPIEIAPTPVVYGNRIYKLRKKKIKSEYLYI